MSDTYRITVVCHGNICRSPMAELMLREAFEDAGLSHQVRVDSAGTSADELGSGAHPRTLATLRRHGHRDLGWSAHRARQFRAEDFDRADLVLAADHPHADRLARLARNEDERARVRLVRSFDPESVAAGHLGMADPWYGAEPEYEQTHAEIAAAVPGIVEHVRRHLKS